MLWPINPPGAAWFRPADVAGLSVNHQALHNIATEPLVPWRIKPAIARFVSRDRDA
jgi:hypothetical protein